MRGRVCGCGAANAAPLEHDLQGLVFSPWKFLTGRPLWVGKGANRAAGMGQAGGTGGHGDIYVVNGAVKTGAWSWLAHLSGGVASSLTD